MSSDDEVTEHRCGFVLEPGDVPEYAQDTRVGPQSFRKKIQNHEDGSDEWYKNAEVACCWREEWNEADDGRCIWHADTDDKPAEELIAVRADGPEQLDGATVPDVELGDAIDFEECGLQAATFAGTGLQETSFAGVNGRYAEFPQADLYRAQFHDADLRRSQFPDTDLRKAQFHDAHLYRAQFRDADLKWAQFPNADLRRAQFPDADLLRVEFPDADLEWARFPGANLKLAQFPNADLSEAQFPDAYLRWARVPEADIFRAQFPEADLYGAQFHHADLIGAQFPAADLRRAQFPHADLRHARFPDADLLEATFHNSDLRGADFTDAGARKATFTNATLEIATFRDADLGNSDLSDSRLHDTQLLDVRINDGTKFGAVVPEEADADWFAATDLSPFDRLLWWLAWCRTDGANSEHHECLDDAATVYRTIQRLYRENSMPRRIDTYHVRARDTRRKQAIIDGDLPRWLYLAAQRWVMGYGEKPLRVVGTSLSVILGCAVAYPLVGGVTETSTDGGTPHYFTLPLPDVLPAWVGLPGAVETVLTSLYFSVVTFTTLGYGDLRPRTGAAQFLATVESLVGAFLLALLVYVLGRRATR